VSSNQAKFVRLLLSEIKAGDKIEVRCTGGKRKGCPFSKKTRTGKPGKSKVDLVSLLKKRYLKRKRGARDPRDPPERDRSAHLVVVAVERGLVLRPEREDDLHRLTELAQTGRRVGERVAVGGVVGLVPARADAEGEAAVSQHVGG
jgi:hypothetical protein